MMERVLVNPSTWTTLDNSSFSRSFGAKSFTGNKSTPISKPVIPPRRSVCEKRLVKIFSSQPDEPLYSGENDDLLIEEEPHNRCSNENLPISNRDICQLLPEAVLLVRHNSSDSGDLHQLKLQEMSTLSKNQNDEPLHITPKENPLIARLQRDLNSPSANARCRALKALKSPTKSIYTNFDIPYEEQDIITAEEKGSPIRPKSIQDVMKNVIVYVEVRTGEDNRTDGVKKVISQMGAKVNDKLLRDTTHVVFKDGLQSTYNKAKKWNIPIVSILWIEECTKSKKLMDPTLFPISNIDRYEYPELYQKIKRQKSMQPDAEDKRKWTKVQKTDVSQKTGRLNSALRIPRKPKDKVDEILSEFHDKIMNTPEDSELPLNSKLLDLIRNSPHKNLKPDDKKTTRNSLKKLAYLDSIPSVSGDQSIDDDDDFVDESQCKTPNVKAKKTLFSSTSKEKSISSTSTVASSNKNIKHGATIPKETPIERKNSIEIATTLQSDTKKSTISTRVRTTISVAHTPLKDIKKTSSNRRKTTFAISTIAEATIAEEQDDGHNSKKDNISIERELEPEENKEIILASQANKSTVSESIRSRRSFNVTTPSNSKEPRKNVLSNRRRTTFAKPTILESDPIEENFNIPKVPPANENNHLNSQRRTSYTARSLETTPVDDAVSNHFKTPMSSAKRQTLNRRTLYTPETMDINNIINECAPKIDSILPGEGAKSAVKNRQTILTEDSMDIDTTIIDNEPKTPTTNTLIDHYNNLVTFSSTKKPESNRRRTVFDISMDIIGQRIQNINSQTPSSKKNINGRSANISKIDYPIEIGNDNNKNESNGSSCIGTEDNTTTIRKKRKLFAPTELMLTPEPTKPTENANLPDNCKGIATQTTITKSTKKRVRDDDFEKDVKVKKRKSDIPKPSAPVEKIKKKFGQLSRRSTMDFESLKKKISTATTNVNDKKQKLPFLVYTNMHTQQIDVIKEAVNKLGGFQLEDNVSDNTTHIVTLEVRRTMNILRGIIRGLWILDYNWILESMSNGKWMLEEQYEIRNFSRAVEICRSERQAFGPGYKIDLFTDIAPIYVSPNCNVPIDNLKELIRLCSGNVVENKRKAKYIIGEFCKKYSDTICLDPLWILDSISINKIKKTHKYLLKTS